MKGETEVRRRIGLLDGVPPGTPIGHSSPLNDLARVIRVMQQVTDGWWKFETDSPEPPTIAPEVADNLVATSETVARTTEATPALTAGPLDSDAQVWTGAGGESDLKHPRQMELARSRFVPPTNPATGPKTKLWNSGLFTSTLVPGTTTTMWLMYQEPFGDHNTLFPKPWRTYHIEIAQTARVYEATDADKWTQLVQAHPIRHNGLIYPDWEHIAHDYDAVHITVPAIVAIQGLRLRTTRGTIAEVYWDVEQTLWLAWRFDGVNLLNE